MEHIARKRGPGYWRHFDWTLRIALASVFLSHGLPKWMNLPATAQALQLPLFLTVLVALAEVGGALLILFGGLGRNLLFDLGTRLGGLAIIPVMLGAIFMVHWGQWSFLPSETHPMGGIEFQTVLLLIALFFVLRGNGPPDD